MDSRMPDPRDLTDLQIAKLGPTRFSSPLKKLRHVFTSDKETILVYPDGKIIKAHLKAKRPIPVFEGAGPRERVYFDSKKLICGIVTCGGLCPGLNDVIRTIVLSLIWQYGVKKVWGFRYGFQGLTSRPNAMPLNMTPEVVDEIQHEGGSILGSSRGPQDTGEMISTLQRYKIQILFVVGGDGTLRAAHELAQEIHKQKLPICIIGVPKTIDNDIYCVEKTFGFSTAVEEARKAIAVAHEEAKAAWNGIGLVKLMGRDAGFIAAYAALANSDANFCFIPEIPFRLQGRDGLLNMLEKRFQKKHHAVIVIAEGAGQDLIGTDSIKERDASGNIRYQDIGYILKERINDHFKKKNGFVTVKYIDPSYMIRSTPANSDDSAFCLMLGQNAVHAGMSGRTDMVISYWNNRFVHVPLCVVVRKRKFVDPHGDLWQTLLETTGQRGKCCLKD